MNLKYNKLGFIEGGLCEERLKNRNKRAIGGWAAWNDCLVQGCIDKSNKMILIKMPKPKHRREFLEGNEEIGYLRIRQLLFPMLIESKKKFEQNTLWGWIEGISACEFSIVSETPFSIIIKEEKFSTGLAPPKPQDDIYYEKIYGIPRGLASN